MFFDLCNNFILNSSSYNLELQNMQDNNQKQSNSKINNALYASAVGLGFGALYYLYNRTTSLTTKLSTTQEELSQAQKLNENLETQLDNKTKELQTTQEKLNQAQKLNKKIQLEKSIESNKALNLEDKLSQKNKELETIGSKLKQQSLHSLTLKNKLLQQGEISLQKEKEFAQYRVQITLTALKEHLIQKNYKDLGTEYKLQNGPRITFIKELQYNIKQIEQIQSQQLDNESKLHSLLKIRIKYSYAMTGLIPSINTNCAIDDEEKMGIDEDFIETIENESQNRIPTLQEKLLNIDFIKYNKYQTIVCTNLSKKQLVSFHKLKQINNIEFNIAYNCMFALETAVANMQKNPHLNNFELGNQPLLEQHMDKADYAKTINAMLKNGANPNLFFGEVSPLNYAFEVGKLDVVIELIKHGALINMENKDGKLPIEKIITFKFSNFGQFMYGDVDNIVNHTINHLQHRVFLMQLMDIMEVCEIKNLPELMKKLEIEDKSIDGKQLENLNQLADLLIKYNKANNTNAARVITENIGSLSTKALNSTINLEKGAFTTILHIVVENQLRIELCLGQLLKKQIDCNQKDSNGLTASAVLLNAKVEIEYKIECLKKLENARMLSNNDLEIN